MKPGAPIDHFDARVAEDLEFDVVQEMLAELSGCPSSEARAQQLVPSKAVSYTHLTLPTIYSV